MDNMPDFSFIATTPNSLTFNCSLWLQNATSSSVYSTKNGAVNGSLTTLTPSSPVPNGVWRWWINCTDDTISSVSEKRNITISVFRGDKTFTSSYDDSSRYYWLDLPDDFDNSAPTPLVFFLHGYGGSRLSYSDPQKYPALRRIFQNHTWIVAAVDCRTVNGYQNWYAEPSRQDITDVLAQLRNSYNIDSSHVHIMGNSMGGGGALKYAMFNNGVIASLVDIHGITNFTQFYYETSTYKASLVAAYGGTPAQVPTVYKNESALGNEQRFNHIPVMILHGTADNVVSVSQSRYLNQSLSALGYTVKYIEVIGVAHDASILISGREMEILNWLRDHPLTAYAVHLLLTVEPNHAVYAKDQELTLSVTIFNDKGLVLASSLTLTVSGPEEYGFHDMQPVSVPAGKVREYSFNWATPNTAGTYVVEVGLAPAQLTAYDATWLRVT
jgi:dipeptidyl aminopeptidase/acylaminoacyl peptidase